MNIAIVIPCFKRVDSLKTLCDGLLKTDYGNDKVTLVFSIDYLEGSNVPEFADGFQWNFGEKVVIKHEKNIGLRNNILSCGDLTQKYDAVIILEDDLEVMPAFYQFAKEAAMYYENDDRIAGISIYQYFLEEMTVNQFIPIDNGSDVYFVKWASSWGQLWTRHQWTSFREWLQTHEDISEIDIPSTVKNWKRSWKKYYIAYLTDTNRYFVFPYRSFIYNGNKEGGTHSVLSSFVITSSPLLIHEKKSFSFVPLNSVKYKYDAFFQLESTVIELNGVQYKVDFDLFGHKERFHSPYVITSRKCKKESVIHSFDAGMLPLELNILYLKRGDVFSLVKVEDLDSNATIPYKSYAPLRKTIRNWKQLLPLGYKSLIADFKTSFNYRFKRLTGGSKRKHK